MVGRPLLTFASSDDTAKKIFFCPAASTDAQRNFRSTVEGAIALSRLPNTVSVSLKKSIRSGARAWGASSKSFLQWSKACPGDILLFSRHASFFAYAKCFYTLDSRDVSLALWGSPEWRCIFVVSAPTAISAPVERVREALNYAPLFKIQRLQALRPDQSVLALAALGLAKFS